MLRKQPFDLMIAALLPVFVLGIGYLIFSVQADQEIVSPTAANNYYNAPGTYEASVGANVWFGREVQSWILCESPNNANGTLNPGGFFDIVSTNETATVSNNATADKIQWNRTQGWVFGTTTPWGGTQANVTLEKSIWTYDTDNANTLIGYPWNGIELHERQSGSGDIGIQTEVTGWWPGPDDDADQNPDWICPKYYKYGGWLSLGDIEAGCDPHAAPNPTLAEDWIEISEWAGEWDDPEQHNGTLARHGQDGAFEIWIDCIEAD